MLAPLSVLFVSRRNSLRSVLADSCLQQLGKGRFKAYSCGRPGQLAPEVHFAAIETLSKAGVALNVVKPRSWDEFARSGAPKLDFVIVLDEHVFEFVPRWGGQPNTALWGYPDLMDPKDRADLSHDATQIFHSLRRRLELLVSLPLTGTDRGAIQSDLRDLGYLK